MRSDPRGDHDPTSHDFEDARRVKHALDLLVIPLLDYVIVGRSVMSLLQKRSDMSAPRVGKGILCITHLMTVFLLPFVFVLIGLRCREASLHARRVYHIPILHLLKTAHRSATSYHMGKKHWIEGAQQRLEESLVPVPHEVNELDWKARLSDQKERLAEHFRGVPLLFVRVPEHSTKPVQRRGQIERIQRLPKAQQRFVMQTLDTELAQADR